MLHVMDVHKRIMMDVHKVEEGEVDKVTIQLSLLKECMIAYLCDIMMSKDLRRGSV